MISTLVDPVLVGGKAKHELLLQAQPVNDEVRQLIHSGRSPYYPEPAHKQLPDRQLRTLWQRLLLPSRNESPAAQDAVVRLQASELVKTDSGHTGLVIVQAGPKFAYLRLSRFVATLVPAPYPEVESRCNSVDRVAHDSYPLEVRIILLLYERRMSLVAHSKHTLDGSASCLLNVEKLKGFAPTRGMRLVEEHLAVRQLRQAQGLTDHHWNPGVFAGIGARQLAAEWVTVQWHLQTVVGITVWYLLASS
mmetsp:Transcript_12193/g.22488  ORF Transcript_12193/g.22488 Transcript_12193/m.22488 type:complete len:249 (+) Transcript_12193:312-1058(+)